MQVHDAPEATDRRSRYSKQISLGNILTIISILGTMLYFYGNLQQSVGAIDTKVDAMWSDFLSRTVKR